MKISMNKIVIDESIYPRSSVSMVNVARLVSAMKTGVKMPPLVVEASTGRLIDGRHRYHGYEELEVKTVEVTQKSYSSEADMFADAVRLNVSHGFALDQFSVNNAIIKLSAYGYAKDQISDVIKVPVDAIDKIERGFATNSETGEPIALKGGLRHLARQQLAPKQIEVNRHYSGMKATFYAKQLAQLLENNMHPRTEAFSLAMDDLVELWEKIT